MSERKKMDDYNKGWMAGREGDDGQMGFVEHLSASSRSSEWHEGRRDGYAARKSR